jgi:divalent metal cation (Fe/Co/Zn/Cd) transporter
VVGGLTLALITGWLPLDPILAMIVALNILWTGGKLMRQSVGGLMDEADEQLESRVRSLLTKMTSEAGVQFHGLRQRSAGNTVWVEFHLLFPKGTLLDSAHALATRIEERLQQELDVRAEVISHLETLEDHQKVHSQEHHERFPD